MQREHYLKMLINKRHNGQVKVITGLRRSGKSYLLNNLYRQYLIDEGVPADYIICIDLDDMANLRFRNPFELDNYIRSLVSANHQMHYIFLDEIQKVVSVDNPYLPPGADKITFVDVVLGLMKLPNVDLYISCSNSKMLSSDILTEFRGRGDEIKVFPLSFSEYLASTNGDKQQAWNDYFRFGGMPYLINLSSEEDKKIYLKQLLEETYLKDIIERNNIKNNKTVLDNLLKVICSSVGSLTNPSKIADTFKSNLGIKIEANTISHYLDCFIDSFLVYKAERYDVKGRKYIGSPMKYYLADPGLRNVYLGFRQTEENHLMENIIYNELLRSGFDVDVGLVVYNYKDDKAQSKRANLEVDFVANKSYQRFYIQSALRVDEEEKRLQETKSLYNISDSFKKIVVVKDDIYRWQDEKGVMFMGITDFLLNGCD